MCSGVARRSLVLLVEVLDDVVAPVGRLSAGGVDEVRNLVIAAEFPQFGVRPLVCHVATLVTRQARVVDDIGDAEFGESFADVRGVRAVLGLVSSNISRATPGSPITVVTAERECSRYLFDGYSTILTNSWTGMIQGHILVGV